MSHSSTYAASLVEADTLSLLAAVQDKSRSFDKWKPLVEILSKKNFNTQKTISLLLNDVNYKAAKGGTEFEGGVFLGVMEDYDETAPSNTKDKSIPDGKICLAGWERNVEIFQLFPKEYLVGLISHIYDGQEQNFLFCDQNFPRLGDDVFWSIGYHFIFVRGVDYSCLIELLQNMCPDKDWKIIPGLSERVGKGKRGDY